MLDVGVPPQDLNRAQVPVADGAAADQISNAQLHKVAPAQSFMLIEMETDGPNIAWSQRAFWPDILASVPEAAVHEPQGQGLNVPLSYSCGRADHGSRNASATLPFTDRYQPSAFAQNILRNSDRPASKRPTAAGGGLACGARDRPARDVAQALAQQRGITWCARKQPYRR